ncbi:alpha-amylase family glycosyl hydrolase [Cohnella faecalis]|uniref:Alpha-amylase n=1 Tax=Cohnella faecalis TaxID=2315694 RepID=A0A398CIE2_9BACL|nr:alpha-amylase family glycosyl hydrolase [Cohnella faecalis]RIE00959.1 hypothetical protein D3H35_25705 [Cohnella faecalis]
MEAIRIMRKMQHPIISAMLALAILVSLFSTGAPAARAEVQQLQSPVIGALNADGKGSSVTFNYQALPADENVNVKGSFYKNWAETIPLVKGDNNVWSLTREIPAGWYQYGISVGNDWKGDDLNLVRNDSNPGLSVPGIKFNASEEVELDSETALSADYYTGVTDTKHAAALSIEPKTGVSIEDGMLKVTNEATPGNVTVTATYVVNSVTVTATQSINIVGELLKSPVINGDGTVTFNNKTHTGDNLYLVGDMNGWDKDAPLPFTKNEGIFSLTLPLEPGKYGYKFLITSGSYNGSFTDPLNPVIADTNSILIIQGIKINSANDIVKGSSIPLTADLVGPAGDAAAVTPTWSLKEEKAGISIANSTLTVDSDYVVPANDFVTVVATLDGKTAEKKINITDKLYTFNIKYYRLDQVLTNWDNWIFRAGMAGTEYDFTGVDSNHFATVAVKLPYTSIKTIQRPGQWTEQDLEHEIFIPEGQDSVDVWIVEGKPDVYYSESEALDIIAQTPVPVKRYIDLTYVRADEDYTDWNLWVWSTGKKNDQILFNSVADGVAKARIEIGALTKRIGFKVRKGDWVETDVNADRYIDAPLEQALTKVIVTSGELAIYSIPSVNGPYLDNGGVTFYYRDDGLYGENEMNTIDSVKVKVTVNGDTQEYPMTYNAKNEYFEYKLPALQEGNYTYSFLVTKDEATTEKNDPRNTVNGVSAFEYRSPEVNVTATAAPNAISSNENAVLSVNLSSTLQGLKYREIFADLSTLGGTSKMPIDLDLRKGTIGVTDSVSAGVKTIALTAVDQYGNKHTGTASIQVKPRQSVGKLDFDWDEARIYFLLTDRFFDGDSTNNADVDKTNLEAYHGGDFKGLIEKLDYIKDLGINTIWISPIVDNIDFNQGVGFGGKQYGYHGYWAKNFETIDEHLGDLDTFKQLLDTAHDKGIKVMVDVVLNHTGYGLKPGDTNNQVEQADKDRFSGMLRTNGVDSGTDEVKGELAGLPDLITEDPAVREKIIDWQAGWLERAKTDRGDMIDYFRVDTIKHVEDTTWRAFKNALTEINPEFKMIGEYYGASIDATGGALRTGQMDSLLDFDFKDRAEQFVESGKINEVEEYLEHRNALIDNTTTMGQFLSSHDEDGFLSNRVGGDKGMLKVAAALQITSKGQPVIYYGEELGQSGKKSGNLAEGQLSENRKDMPWDKVSEEQALHDHYKKLLNIRAEYSKVFSKGTRTKVAGSDSDGYLVFDRAYENRHVLVGLNTTSTEKTVTIEVPFEAGIKVTDLYDNNTLYTVSNDHKVTIQLPSRDNGGTFILAAAYELELASAAVSVTGTEISMQFNRPLDHEVALAANQFELVNTAATVASAEYTGSDNKTITLHLNGKIYLNEEPTLGYSGIIGQSNEKLAPESSSLLENGSTVKALTVGTPQFKNLAGDPVTTLTNNGFIKVTVGITNHSVNGEDGTLIVVLKNAGGDVVNAAYVEKSISGGGTETLTAGFKLPNTVTGYYIEVFVWDTLDGMQPLSNKITFPQAG